MNEFMLQLITLVHILFILFIVVVPFTNSNYLLMLHVIVVPFMIAHWIINDNTCVLTIIEKKMRKEMYGTEPDPNDCFTCRLIEPIYDFNKNHNALSAIIYGITISLWALSVYKLYSRYRSGSITSFVDLFTF